MLGRKIVTRKRVLGVIEKYLDGGANNGLCMTCGLDDIEDDMAKCKSCGSCMVFSAQQLMELMT